MSTAITTVSKHSWSREEITLVTRAFLEGKTVKEAHSLVPDIKLTSVKQKGLALKYVENQNEEI